MANISRRRIGVACQGGGSHTAFTAGVLQGLLSELPEDAEVVGFSGTSGGAICAALAWEGLLRRDPTRASDRLQAFWETTSAKEPWDQLANQCLVGMLSLKDLAVLPEITPYQLPPWGEDRRPGLLTELRRYGRAKWRWFAKERAAKRKAASVQRAPVRGAAPSSEQLPSE